MTDTAIDTATDTSVIADDAIVDELETWLDGNWDPEISLGEWWERLGPSGWAVPTWPTDWFGRDASRDLANRIAKTITAHGAVGAPAGLGLLLAGPTIVTHGTDDQRNRYLEDIVTGRKAWCQLFSEPAAGSDLAGLQTKAVKDGDEWVVTGQKVWTSGGQVADLAMLIARTDAEVPKHQGISYFAIDMDQPGIDIRPLKEMTGQAMFNEVFLDEAVADDDALIGGLNKGWAVANTTLANERAGLGAGGGSAAGGRALPGTKAGQLERRVGDFAPKPGRQRGRGGVLFGAAEQMLVELAKENGQITDPTVRQDLMRLHTLNEIARYTNLRMKAAKAQGKAPGPEANTAKLSMSRIVRLSRDTGLRILGPHGTLLGEDAPAFGMVAGMALFSPAPSIYGGTDEVQKNIVGERVLGLPKEPNNDRTVAFKDLPKNG